MPGSGRSAEDQPSGLRHQVTSASGATFAIFALDRVIQVGFLAILARLLLPEEFAVATAATLFVSLVVLASHMGVGAALVQHTGLSERVALTARTIVISSAVILVLATEVFAPLVGAWFRNPEVTGAVRVLAPLCILQAAVFVPHALLTRRLKATSLTALDLLSGVVGQGMVAIPLALMGLSYWALIAGLLAQAVVRVLGLLVMHRLPVALPFDLEIARTLWTRGLGFSLTLFLQRTAAEGDRIIVGRYLGAAELGLYARANGLMAFPAALYGAVADRVAFPAFAQVQAEPARLAPAYSQAMALTALIGAPITVMLVLLGPEIIQVVLGQNWLGAIAPFKILAVAVYFRMADRVNGTLLRGVGKPYLMASMQVLVAIAIITGCLLLVSRGIAFVAMVAVGASLLSYLCLTAAAMRAAGLDFAGFLRAHQPAACSALLVVAVAAPAHWLAVQQGWGPFVTLLAVGTVTAITGLAAVFCAPSLVLGPAGASALASLMSFRRPA